MYSIIGHTSEYTPHSALFCMFWSTVLPLPSCPMYTLEHEPWGFCKPHRLVNLGHLALGVRAVGLTKVCCNVQQAWGFCKFQVVPVPSHMQLQEPSCMQLVRTGAWWFFLIPYWLYCLHEWMYTPCMLCAQCGVLVISFRDFITKRSSGWEIMCIQPLDSGAQYRCWAPSPCNFHHNIEQSSF